MHIAFLQPREGISMAKKSLLNEVVEAVTSVAGAALQ